MIRSPPMACGAQTRSFVRWQCLPQSHPQCNLLNLLQNHLQSPPLNHQQCHPQSHQQCHPQNHQQCLPQSHPQCHLGTAGEGEGKTTMLTQNHRQCLPQSHPQCRPQNHLQSHLQCHLPHQAQ